MPLDTALVEGLNTPASPAKAAGKLRLLTLSSLDGRTMAARRARQLVEAIEADLGGPNRLSEGSRQLVQRAAVLGTFIESCEAAWLGGDAVDLAAYLSAINSQRRVLATIGLERVPRPVLTLQEHLASLARERPQDADDEGEALPADADSESAA